MHPAHNALPEAAAGRRVPGPVHGPAPAPMWLPPVVAPPPTRASDADRDRTVALLREHWQAGRLTLAELEARSEQAWGARLVAELWDAVRELPVPIPSVPAPAIRPAGGSGVVPFVLGVVGTCLLLLSFGMLFLISLPLTTGAWVSGRRARRRLPDGRRGLALAGETLGIVATVLGCLALASCGAMVAWG